MPSLLAIRKSFVIIEPSSTSILALIRPVDDTYLKWRSLANKKYHCEQILRGIYGGDGQGTSVLLCFLPFKSGLCLGLERKYLTGDNRGISRLILPRANL